MACITNFLKARSSSSLESSEKAYMEAVDDYVSYRNSISSLMNLGIPLNDSTEVRDKIMTVENKKVRAIWEKYGVAPRSVNESFNRSIFGDKSYYAVLNDIDKYPKVGIGNLCQIADNLGFVIAPVDYVDLDVLFANFASITKDKLAEARLNTLPIGYDYLWYLRFNKAYNSKNYSEVLKSAYIEFQEVLKAVELGWKYWRYDVSKINKKMETNRFTKYIICPLSYYNVWKHITSEVNYPVYFSESLNSIGTTLSMMIPAQRNLYKMTSDNKDNIAEIKSNIDSMKEAMTTFESRLNHVELAVESLACKVSNMNQSIEESRRGVASTISALNLKVSELESMIYCMLDPLIFAAPKVLKFDLYDTLEYGIVGMCFGPDMPVDFFVNKGLVEINDNNFDNITYPFYNYVSEESMPKSKKIE